MPHAYLKPLLDGRFVLRLYPKRLVEPDGTVSTIWLGTVTREQLYHPLGQLSLLLSDDGQRAVRLCPCCSFPMPDWPAACGPGTRNMPAVAGK
ncbi:MAG: hypothetical protein KDI44_06620 [Thiothrix sp.]|nr:hypothetical protein [Thiothrix sp.]